MPSEEVAAKIREAGRSLMLSNHTMELYSAKATPKQAEFLLGMFGCELTYRDQNKRRRLICRAAFPVPKSFEGYDWSPVSLPLTITKEELTKASFIECAENVICYGPVGVGKSHLMTAVGMKACELGMKVRFITASELVLRLVSAKEAGTLDKVLADFASNDALLLDEFGYVPIDRDGSRLLFQVIARCYESKSLMLTTNLEFSRWGSILTEEQMASALVDRLLHHGHVITFKGESYRMRHALMNESGKGGDSHGRY
jgi:DNA replication protein DnaC